MASDRKDPYPWNAGPCAPCRTGDHRGPGHGDGGLCDCGCRRRPVKETTT